MIAKFFECSCHSSEHNLKFIYDEEYNELYTEIYLHQYRNLFKRIFVAIKYIFGYKSKFGAWDCFLFKNKDIDDLKKLINRIKSYFLRKRKNQIDVWFVRWNKACERSWKILNSGEVSKEKFLRWEKNHKKLLAISMKKQEEMPPIIQGYIQGFRAGYKSAEEKN